MRTAFQLAQLADPALAEAERNLRACVHCGICTASCPTYVLLGDERDSPRGRIVMMQQMLEEDAAPSAETVLHLDRCLSCLGCRSACPSGVDYARLIDLSRAHIETRYRRPLADRLMRWIVATVLPHPALARMALSLAQIFSPLTRLLPGRLGAMARTGTRIGRTHSPARSIDAGANPRRVALLRGCVQQAMAPEIDEAVARVLARRGIALTPLEGAGCCGALSHHLGREDEAKAWARRAIEAFEQAGGSGAFDGVLITATGCAAHIEDYPHLFLGDPEWQDRAGNFAATLRTFSELVTPRPSEPPRSLRVALHLPCSLQHGLRRPDGAELLAAAGFEVLAIPEGHLCCGSAGSYSLLQPEIAQALRARKLANIETVGPDAVATSNIGCLQHLSGPEALPVVHIAELIDWAEGGPEPGAIASGRRDHVMTKHRTMN
ncbi:MAG TPA: glycolate oxidase subunit GlcF [Rhizomicrobium sp.]|jgi:glycolate oxidase iron-sulfur subunit